MLMRNRKPRGYWWPMKQWGLTMSALFGNGELAARRNRQPAFIMCCTVTYMALISHGIIADDGTLWWLTLAGMVSSMWASVIDSNSMVTLLSDGPSSFVPWNKHSRTILSIYGKGLGHNVSHTRLCAPREGFVGPELSQSWQKRGGGLPHVPCKDFLEDLTQCTECVKGRPYSFDAPYIWALPVWGYILVFGGV